MAHAERAFNEPAANASADVRAALEKGGKSIGPLDALIGACALSLGAVLVTNNARVFRRTKGLAAEDWLA